MTTLNTIIEEEVDNLFDTEYMTGKQPNLTKENVTSAMQRAYEAGLTGAYRVKEIVEDCGHQQEDGSVWIKMKEVIKKTDTHLDQLKKEIRG